MSWTGGNAVCMTAEHTGHGDSLGWGWRASGRTGSTGCGPVGAWRFPAPSLLQRESHITYVVILLSVSVGDPFISQKKGGGKQGPLWPLDSGILGHMVSPKEVLRH